ncbi:hypothetical protein HDU97_003475 [Phlyctochytrium planicorne]|nr:hypothetical protein HDU97_003475 [Phlyctochytrium planicorne]
MSHIRVALRLRKIETEERGHRRACINIADGGSTVQVQRHGSEGKRTFSFDAIYGFESTQEQIYKECCFELVESFVGGTNASIFAYGQTSSGKTYTMGGHYRDEEERDGIIPRAAKDIFSLLEKKKVENPFIIYELTCHFVEIYQEQSISKEHVDEMETTKTSKLHLIDLAGSERLKRTKAEGIRLKESVKINSGLLALGNVIGVLGSDTTRDASAHVPYRDSKLTRFLQDSIGGNSKTLMIACVSSKDEDFEETLNTLKYAERARRIQNKPVTSEFSESTLQILRLKQRIEELEREKETMKAEAVNVPDPPIASAAENDQGTEGLNSHLIEELKIRTIRGTNALKSLRKATKENKRLSLELEQLKLAIMERTQTMSERINVGSQTVSNMDRIHLLSTAFGEGWLGNGKVLDGKAPADAIGLGVLDAVEKTFSKYANKKRENEISLENALMKPQVNPESKTHTIINAQKEFLGDQFATKILERLERIPESSILVVECLREMKNLKQNAKELREKLAILEQKQQESQIRNSSPFMSYIRQLEDVSCQTERYTLL